MFKLPLVKKNKFTNYLRSLPHVTDIDSVKTRHGNSYFKPSTRRWGGRGKRISVCVPGQLELYSENYVKKRERKKEKRKRERKKGKKNQ